MLLNAGGSARKSASPQIPFSELASLQPLESVPFTRNRFVPDAGGSARKSASPQVPFSELASLQNRLSVLLILDCPAPAARRSLPGQACGLLNSLVHSCSTFLRLIAERGLLPYNPLRARITSNTELCRPR
jgi:hypothetical protein